MSRKENIILISLILIIFVCIIACFPIETEMISCTVIDKYIEDGGTDVSVHPYFSVTENPDKYIIKIEGVDSKGIPIHTIEDIVEDSYNSIKIGDKFNYKHVTKTLGEYLWEVKYK